MTLLNVEKGELATVRRLRGDVGLVRRLRAVPPRGLGRVAVAGQLLDVVVERIDAPNPARAGMRRKNRPNSINRRKRRRRRKRGGAN